MTNQKRKAPRTPSRAESPAKSREDVLRDFRKIAGPLRGRNRDPKPKT